MTKTFTIRTYKNENGDDIFQNWLDGFKDKNIKARIISRIGRLQLGNFGDAKKLDKDISELRFNFGSGYRIYYGLAGNQIVILLCGGDKASQKNDIKNAKIYWQDFCSRSE